MQAFGLFNFKKHCPRLAYSKAEPVRQKC